jgi:hypothetical protein
MCSVAVPSGADGDVVAGRHTQSLYTRYGLGGFEIDLNNHHIFLLSHVDILAAPARAKSGERVGRSHARRAPTQCFGSND